MHFIGPLLWNIGYDWVLRDVNPEGVEITCYADDTLVTAKGKTFCEALLIATNGVNQVVSRIRRLGLEVALDKSEVLCFHGPRKAPPAGSRLTIGGVNLEIQPAIKYLGLMLDGRLNFHAHFKYLSPKLLRTATWLSRLLPNLKGPNSACRQLYAGIVRSIALYGAPVWAESLTTRNIILLRKPQRLMAIRVIRAYRTVAFDAACVLARTVPWDLDARALSSLFHWREEVRRNRGFILAPIEMELRKRQLRRDIAEAWTRRLASAESGLRTIRAILPVFNQWMERQHGVLSFRMTQILTGHGCFGRYLSRIGVEPNAACHHCSDAEDSAEHTLQMCSAWTEERYALRAIIGNDLGLPALVRGMVNNEVAWRATRFDIAIS